MVAHLDAAVDVVHGVQHFAGRESGKDGGWGGREKQMESETETEARRLRPTPG